MKIHSYYSQSGTDLIKGYIDDLTTDEQVDAYDVLNQLEENKTETLNIKKWDGKILEVYFYKHNRIFYVVAEEENVYLLHACRKQKNKTEKKDSRIIIARAKELSKIIKKRII